MKLTPQEARSLQQRLEEIAAEIRAAADLLLAAAGKKAEPIKQEQATHEQKEK